MATTVQQPYNLFATPKLTKPVQAYDPKKSIEDNMNGEGNPSPQNIINAYRSPYAQRSGQVAATDPPHTEKALDGSSSTAGMEYLNSLYTTPEQEEKMRKASVMNQRILAIGDAMRHIGNIANTIKGAPSQEFNSPVLEEQARYERGKALRDKANQTYMSYQQQKAAQDAAARKFEQQFQLKQADEARKEALNDARISRYNAMTEKDAANKVYWETRARYIEEGWPLEKAIKEARKAQIEAQTKLSNVRANQGGGSSNRSGKGMDEYTVTSETEYTYNADGTKTGSKSTKTRTVNRRGRNYKDGSSTGKEKIDGFGGNGLEKIEGFGSK